MIVSKFEQELMVDLLKRISKLRLTRISLVAGLVIALGLTAGWSRPKDVADVIMPILGLKSGELITIDQGQAGKSEMAITMDGQDYTIDYTFHSNRSKQFRLLVQQENGEVVEQDAPTVSTIRGALRGVDGSRVIGCITEAGCCAKIYLPNGENCYLEPINRTIDNPAFAGVHVVYSADDVISSEARCGAETNLADAEQSYAYSSRSTRSTHLLEAELSVDADFEYFSIFGSADATLAQMELIINIVNDQYESEVGIRHTIFRAMIWTTKADPFTTSDSSALLRQFAAFYPDIEKLPGVDLDLCHLFTGRDLDGNTIGIANPGGACSFISEFGLSQHFTPLFRMTDLVAHELGHNWGAGHCACPNHTMNPVITGANDFHDTITIPVIIDFRDSFSRITCLEPITPPVNDDLADDISIGDLNFSVTGSNINATTEAEEANLVTVGSSVWWQVNADEDVTITIDTFGSDFDTQLYVYEAVPDGDLANLILVGDNDDASGLQSEVTIDVTAGTCYKIRVGGSRSSQSIGDGSEGNIVLNGTVDRGVLLGDVNLDGVVNFLDIPSFISILSSGGFQAEADFDQSGFVDFLDITPFVAILTGS